MIKYQCQCGEVMESPDSVSGGSEKCPKCGQMVNVPRPLRVKCPHCVANGGSFLLYDLTATEATCPTCGWHAALRKSVKAPQNTPAVDITKSIKVEDLTAKPTSPYTSGPANRMVIAYPTGTGKTLIQAEIIRRCYQEKSFKCAMILSPYILLTYQHLKEIADHLIAYGINAEYLNISSGRFDDSEIAEAANAVGWTASHIESTTDPAVIKTKYDAAMAAGRLLIISSTYQSAMRVSDAGVRPNIQMNDEAHFMCSENGQYIECLDISERSYSFTATPKSGVMGSKNFMSWKDGRDANGNQLYIPNPKWGKIYYKSPKSMIDAGEMMKPILHMVMTYDDDPKSPENPNGIAQRFEDNDYDAIWRCIEQSFGHHENWLKTESVNPEKIGGKVLITVKDQLTMRGILESKEFANFLKTRPSDFHVFAISSDYGVYMDGTHHGDAVNKSQFLKQLKAIPQDHRAIVIYVDMLNEGIDVPGITAFLPFRAIGASKFKQGLGRASRLTVEDRIKFYSGEIQSAAIDYKKYIKPHSAIIIPMAVVNSDEWADEYKRIWTEILMECGDFYEFILSADRYKAFKKVAIEDPVNELAKILRTSDSGVRNFIHYIMKDPQNARMDMDDICAAELASKYNIGIVQDVFDQVRYSTDRAQNIRSRAIFNESEGITFERMVKQSKNSGQGVFADGVKKKFGTIYTPDHVIIPTIDLAFKYLDPSLDRTELKYCDPAAGDGNFFAVLYKKLMADPQFIARFPDEVDRSRYIVTKNIWGFEILKAMHTACQIRLVMMHLDTCKRIAESRNEDHTLLCAKECAGLVSQLHVYWGNTIKLPPPHDTSFKPDVTAGEGDYIADDSIRNMKFDVIVGNPPYTRLEKSSRSSGYSDTAGVRYSGYYDQRDLAQIFVLWAFDHCNHAISFNISDTILGKIVDGATGTRTRIDGHLVEINRTDEVLRYSENDGGDQNTCILCLTRGTHKSIVYTRSVGPDNGREAKSDSVYYDPETFINGDFKKICTNMDYTYPFHATSIATYMKPLQERRTVNSSSADGKSRKKKCAEIIYAEYSQNGKYYIIGNMNQYLRSTYKLIKTDNIAATIDANFVARVKYGEVPRDIGMWLLGYWGTGISSHYLPTYTDTRQEGNYQFKTFLWKFMQVPDFDWYKTNKPQQHADFLKWVEDNMGDKEKFLAGIDAEFEKLIK